MAFPLQGQVNQQGSEQFRQASEAMRHGDLRAAGDGFSAAVKSTPTFAEAHFNLGLVREEQGRLEEAVSSLQKALTLKPQLHGANLFLAVTYYRMNRFEPALTAIRKETEIYPKDASAWMWLGVIQLAADHPEDAAAALDKAAKLAPDNVDILYHRGKAHLLVSRNSYARMFKIDAQSWRVHQVIAQANSEADRHGEAVAEYLAAIKIAPTQPGLHEELGSEYRSLGKAQESQDAFLKELEIDPNNVTARYKLGVLAVEAGDGGKGKELIEEAVRTKPGLQHADYNLGRAERLLGNDAAAVQHLERATTAAGSDPEVIEQAWYQLAIVYRHLQRNEDAKRALTTFQRLKDESSGRQQQLLEKRRAVGTEVAPAPEEVNPPG
jgi:tetratricopeptide (TPR) repeat protein